jgi:hypothetical protein
MSGENPQLDIVAESLAQHPNVKQILGCMNKETDGLHVVIDGEQYIVTIRPRHDGESFTLYEMQELGPKGHAQ